MLRVLPRILVRLCNRWFIPFCPAFLRAMPRHRAVGPTSEALAYAQEELKMRQSTDLRDLSLLVQNLIARGIEIVTDVQPHRTDRGLVADAQPDRVRRVIEIRG